MLLVSFCRFADEGTGESPGGSLGWGIRPGDSILLSYADVPTESGAPGVAPSEVGQPVDRPHPCEMPDKFELPASADFDVRDLLPGFNKQAGGVPVESEGNRCEMFSLRLALFGVVGFRECPFANNKISLVVATTRLCHVYEVLSHHARTVNRRLFN